MHFNGAIYNMLANFIFVHDSIFLIAPLHLCTFALDSCIYISSPNWPLLRWKNQ